MKYFYEIMMYVFCGLVILSLGGCAQVQKVGDLMDETSASAHEVATTYICDKVRIKEWIEVYGADTEKAYSWNVICNKKSVKALPAQQQKAE